MKNHPVGLRVIIALSALGTLQCVLLAIVTYIEARTTETWIFVGSALLAGWVTFGLFRLDELARKVLFGLAAVSGLVLGLQVFIGIPLTIFSDGYTLDLGRVVGSIVGLAFNLFVLLYLSDKETVALFNSNEASTGT